MAMNTRHRRIEVIEEPSVVGPKRGVAHDLELNLTGEIAHSARKFDDQFQPFANRGPAKKRNPQRSFRWKDLSPRTEVFEVDRVRGDPDPGGVNAIVLAEVAAK